MIVNWEKPIEARLKGNDEPFPARLLGKLNGYKHPMYAVAITVFDGGEEPREVTEDGQCKTSPTWIIYNKPSNLLLSGWFCYEKDVEDGFVTDRLEVKNRVKSQGFKVFPINVELKGEV